MNGRIHLRNMAFFGYHGHHPEETVRGQRFLVDLTLTCDFAAAAASDELASTVDYVRVFEVCRRIVEGEGVKLLETLAHRIMAAVLAESPGVSRVDITIKKPAAPIPGVLDYVAVEASCERPECLDRPGQ